LTKIYIFSIAVDKHLHKTVQLIIVLYQTTLLILIFIATIFYNFKEYDKKTKGIAGFEGEGPLGGVGVQKGKKDVM
jgi:predicted permease